MTLWYCYSAYKLYLEDPECLDRRSEKKKKKHGKNLKIRRNFPVLKSILTYHASCVLHVLMIIYYIVQCAKQPFGSVVCGFYVCEYIRACGKFKGNWRQLKKSMN